MTDTPQVPDAAPAPVVRPFAQWMLEMRDGDLADELATALHDLVAAVRDTGKGGILNLKVAVRPAGKHDSNAVVISDAVKLTLPEHDRAELIFYVDGSGNVSRRDPRQLVLPGIQVVPTTGEVRDVPAPAFKGA